MNQPLPNPTKQAEPSRNPTPKQRFCSTTMAVSAHRTMVDSDAFTRGCDFAMLQYQLMVAGQITDANAAAAVGMKLQGAIEFMTVLRNLADSAPPAPRKVDLNLVQ